MLKLIITKNKIEYINTSIIQQKIMNNECKITKTKNY